LNDVIASTVIYSFLAFPPALLTFKFIKKRPRWWLIVLLVILFAVLGWGLVIAAYVGEQARISELIDQKRYEELPEGWDSDGASGLFAVFGGWLFPLAYFVLWLVPYTLAATIRRLITSNQAPNQVLQTEVAKPRR